MSRTSFEVQILSTDHWIYQSEHTKEEVALAEAQELLQGNIDGARVMRLWHRSDGAVTEREIFSEKGSGAQKKGLQVVPIDDAPNCAALEDFYALDSRFTMGKLLRKYLDEFVHTPTEMLHAYSPLKRFMDGDLYASAVDRVAAVQVRGTDKDSKDRRDELYRFIDAIAMRASRAEGRKPIRRSKAEDFPGMVQAAEESVEVPGERDFLVNVILARYLVGQRSFVGKLEWLLEQVPKVSNPKDVAILDGVIADIVASAMVVQDMLGAQTNLCAALVTLLDLLEGKAGPVKGGAEKAIAELGQWFAKGQLPDTAEALLAFVRRQVAGPSPLARNDPSQEEDAFFKLTSRLFGARSIIGGAPMAEGLTRRFGRTIEEGGRAGEEKAIEGMAKAIGSRVHRAIYFLTLAQSRMGGTHQTFIVRLLGAMIREARDIYYFCHPNLSVKAKLSTIKNLQDMILATSFPDDVRKTLVYTALDKLVNDYLIQDKVIEKLDNPSDALRARAIRMVQFCGSGVILDGGQAMFLSRQRVIQYLRAPNFVEHFTNGEADPAKRETMVRDFYRLLAQAGFKQ